MPSKNYTEYQVATGNFCSWQTITAIGNPGYYFSGSTPQLSKMMNSNYLLTNYLILQMRPVDNRCSLCHWQPFGYENFSQTFYDLELGLTLRRTRSIARRANSCGAKGSIATEPRNGGRANLRS